MVAHPLHKSGDYASRVSPRKQSRLHLIMVMAIKETARLDLLLAARIVLLLEMMTRLMLLPLMQARLVLVLQMQERALRKTVPRIYAGEVVCRLSKT